MPESLYYFSCCHVCVLTFEPLMSLQCEDKLQVRGPHAVIQKTIVSDLLES